MREWFACISETCADHLGRPWALLAALALCLGWLALGPLMGWSDTWQLLINTPTTVLTYLFMFLIQNTQNRNSKALHLKLDELIRVGEAHNELIAIQNKSEAEIGRIERDICATN